MAGIATEPAITREFWFLNLTYFGRKLFKFVFKMRRKSTLRLICKKVCIAEIRGNHRN